MNAAGRQQLGISALVPAPPGGRRRNVWWDPRVTLPSWNNRIYMWAEVNENMKVHKKQYLPPLNKARSVHWSPPAASP